MKSSTLDLTLFRWVDSQTSISDRLALLSIREALCSAFGHYRYLEVGSHLGGSLQPHVVDARCLKVFSIDPRPPEQHDERWTYKYKYEGNSTQRMIDLLALIPNADMTKVRTFESASWEISPTSISDAVDFAFIDGEHTNVAVVRDFQSVRRFLSRSAVVAFHDSGAIAGAILKIRRLLRHEKLAYQFFHFPRSAVVAIVFDPDRLGAALIEYGWQPRLPFTQWHVFKLAFAKRLPRLWSALRGIKRLCSGSPCI